jgi:pseudouridine synthase
LLLLTNDGDFANKLTARESHVPKTYLVKVTGTLSADQEEQFRHGLPIEGRQTAPAGLKLIRAAENPWYEVRLFEGRKNQIRMMFKYSGVLVEKLKRVRVGGLTLGSMKPGEFRYLTPEEVVKLMRVEKKPRPAA